MGQCDREKAGINVEPRWDILVIADTERVCHSRRAIVEEYEGATIITTRTQETAIELLRTVAVDVIYNFPPTGKHEKLHSFNTIMAERYPNIRVMDMWKVPSREQRENE